ncbi:MAG: discoidin domain-containing protein [Verrucomicrobia bacterium]|nr:discoidin domain-containing protein [Verrucomicrobiota bacterium]
MVQAVTCAAQPQLRWDDSPGVLFQAGTRTVRWGGDSAGDSLRLEFPAAGIKQRLLEPSLRRPEGQRLLLVYESVSSDGVPLRIERRMEGRTDREGDVLFETFNLSVTRPLTNDIEVAIPFTLPVFTGRMTNPLGKFVGLTATCPLKNGWARSFGLSSEATRVEYRLGNFITGKETPSLALPMVLVQGQEGATAVFTDPMFSTLFSLRSNPDQIEGTLRFRYAASKVPISAPEPRTFAIWIPHKHHSAEGFPAAVDAWYRLMLPEVPPGPKWLHEIAMVDYDFLSDDGQGWERDLRALAGWLKPAERRRVALCLHGWYDALGRYCYDAQTPAMKDEWVAFERTRKVRFTKEELNRRLGLARDLGFRVLLYFGDGLAADSGVPGYRDDWAYRDAKGNKITGWQGPDTFGPTYLLNPAHPEVQNWYRRYLEALLQIYGDQTDGFVWDETFHAPVGQIAGGSQPAYCDRAMMTLVGRLTRRVHRFDPQKVFLASDCIGVFGWNDVPGYAMVADGTYQDTHCDSVAWSYGLFPNWRNTLWSCNWADITGFQLTRWGVRTFGVPVAISNGWGDDCGPSEWSPRQRDAFLGLFGERLKMRQPVRFLSDDPDKLVSRAPDHPVQGDLIPEPAPGEVNWALAAKGSHASASSQDASGSAIWPASGAIDGGRDDAGWGTGHGWASKGGESLPQWLEVDFGQERALRRFVVITYQKDKSAETAGKWGVQNYTIGGWDKRKQRWKPLVVSAAEFPAKVRVHNLPKPARTDRFRVVVSAVAPLDGQARLLQIEAWGE